MTKRKEKKEEVEEEDEEEEKESSVVVQMVYDMRGSEVRLLTNLKNEVPMPELQYNVRLVVDSVELEMEGIDRDLRSDEATLERLKEEKERLVVVAERQRKQLYSMGEILSVLDQLGEEEDSTLDSLAVAEQFIELRSRFPEDFKLLTCLALPAHMLCLCLLESFRDGILFRTRFTG